jgi:hypothetical protein
MTNPLIITDNQILIQAFNAQQTPTGWKIKDSDCNLLFNPQIQLETQRLTFHSSNITFQNMNLLGSLEFHKCNVVIINSQISPNQKETDFVILADNETTLITYHLTIDSKNINSVIVDNKSTSSFTNSKISNFLTGANVKNGSKAFFVNCTIQNEQNRDDSQFLNISNASHVQAIETNFVKCINDGIGSSTSF